MTVLTVLIPTFNEAENVRPLIAQLNDQLVAIDAEIVFVDDSTDHTPAVILEVAASSGLPVRMVHRPTPEGKLAGAVVEGLRLARSPWVVVMDGDLQHPPSSVPVLYNEAVASGADVVVASRYVSGGDAGGLDGRFRRTVSSWSGRSAKTLFPRRLAGCTDPMSGFFAVRPAAVRLDSVVQCGYKVLLALLVHQQLVTREVPFVFAERNAGESKASLKEGLRYVRLLALLRRGTGPSRPLPGSTSSERPLMQHRSAAARAVAAPRRAPGVHRAPTRPATGPAAIRIIEAPRELAAPMVDPDAAHLPTPPSRQEKYSYIDGGQKRALLFFQLLAFAGVVVSFGQFATSAYLNFIFLIPLVVLVLEQLLSTYTGTRPRLVTLTDHLATVELWSPPQYPSVDVYLTTAGEEVELVENTMKYMARLQWPGELNLYVLDDGGRPAIADLADSYDMRYIARPGSEFKKAGNLRYGFDRSDGEFILILDADFAARQDLLTELVPYFDVPTVGIVQSPQYAGTTRQMGWVERSAGAVQELFYRFIQPSRDRHGAAICVGAGAVYRRSALEAIGGFPKIGHSEDIYTGLELTRAGYRTQYVPVVLTKGLSPDNLDNFISQQYRWCEGSMTMLWTRDFHTDETMTLPARLSFWSGFLYYISTAMYAFVAPLPAVIMVWFHPTWIRGWQIVWLSGAVLMWLVVYPVIMRSRWRVEALRLQVVYGFAHAFNIVHLLAGKLAGWHPTNAKAPAPLALSVRRTYTWYLGLGQLALIVGLALRLWQYGLGPFWGMAAFGVLNLYILVPLVYGGLPLLRRSARPGGPPSTQSIDSTEADRPLTAAAGRSTYPELTS